MIKKGNAQPDPDISAGELSTSMNIKNMQPATVQNLERISAAMRTARSAMARTIMDVTMQDPLRLFCISSSLCDALDQEVARAAGATLKQDWFDADWPRSTNAAWCSILGLESEDDMNEVLLRAAPALSLRARQTLQYSVWIPRGIAMTFALFVETSLRGIDTLMRAYREILSPAGIGLATVLRDASEIRQALLAPPLMLNGPAGALGKYCRCDIFSPPDYQQGAWRAIVTLDALKTRNVRNAATRQFELPVLDKRLITPDGPYGVAVPDGEGWKMGFCFREGRAELHLYSNGIAEGENPVTLQEVAETLCAGVDSIFSGHDGDVHP